MLIQVQFHGSSDHMSEPNAVNASFGSADGTSVTIKVGRTARDELVLGAWYDVNIQPSQPAEAPKEVSAI